MASFFFAKARYSGTALEHCHEIDGVQVKRKLGLIPTRMPCTPSDWLPPAAPFWGDTAWPALRFVPGWLLRRVRYGILGPLVVGTRARALSPELAQLSPPPHGRSAG